MARASVIIPTYNRAHMVGEAIDSALRQTFQDLEIIVVDDASTDGTQALLASYGNRIRAIRRDVNGGVAAARNVGIQASRGDLLAFLDSDDLWEPTRLAGAVAFLDSYPDYGAVYADMVMIDPTGKLPSRRHVTTRCSRRSGWILDEVLRHGVIATQTITVRREVIDCVGLFDETLATGEDWDLWWRIARRYKIGYLDEVVCTYRITPGSLTFAGLPAAESCVRRTRKALSTFADLTPRQRRLLQRRLSSELRNYAFYVAEAGRHQEARAARRAALGSALAARSCRESLKSTVALIVGHRGRRWFRRLKGLRWRARFGGDNARPDPQVREPLLAPSPPHQRAGDERGHRHEDQRDHEDDPRLGRGE